MESVPREEIRQRISRFQTELAANDLEPMFVLPKQGVVGLEDEYLVTSDGLKRLTLTEQSLIQI